MSNTTNYRHAAVVLKSLPNTTANRFLADLDPLQSQKIVMEMKETRVTAANLSEAIAQLKANGLDDSSYKGEAVSKVNTASHPQIFRIDSPDYRANFGENVGLHLQPNLDFSSSGRVSFEKDPFAFLTSYQDALLGRVFSDLKARSASIILSTMSFDFALKRLNAMQGLRKVKVMRGIAELGDLHPAEISDLKFAVRLQIQHLLKKDPSLNQKPIIAPQNGPKPTQLIRIESGQSRQSTLKHNAKLIAGLLDMPDAKVKELLKTIDTADLAPALKTCPLPVQKKILKNMAKKPAAILYNEIVNVRIDQRHRISKARRSIATAIQRLKK